MDSPPRKRRKQFLPPTKKVAAKSSQNDSISISEILNRRLHNAKTFISFVPMDVQLLIHKYLGLSDLRNCTLTCTRWKDIINNFWNRQLFMHFSRHRPTDLTVDFISNHCASLRSLRMENCTEISSESMANLSRLQNLESIALVNYTLTGREFEVFAQLPLLHVLKLLDCKSGTPVEVVPLTEVRPRHGIEKLEEMTKLTHLELQYQLSDADISQVCNCTSLVHLVLKGGDRVTNEGIQNISRLQKLVHLSLKKKSMITDEGLPSICQLTSLRSLSIWGGVITDSGISQLSKSLTGLQYICVGSALLTNKGIETLAFKFTNAVLQHLVHLPLVSLELWFCHGISDEGMSILANMSRLSSLNLGHCSKVTSEGIQHLTRLSSLTNLNVVACTLHNLVPLSKLPNLKSLSIGSSCIQDAQISHLNGIQKLANLFIRDSPITDASIAHLANLKLKMLELDACNEITDDGLRQLAACNSLIRLTISNCKKIESVDVDRRAFPNFNVLIK